MTASSSAPTAAEILARADSLQRQLGDAFRDQLVVGLFERSDAIARKVVQKGARRGSIDSALDRWLTSPVTGLPIMLAMLAVILWVTIVGANIPSAWLGQGLFWIEEQADRLFTAAGAPWWLTGFVWHGVYRGLAWVVSVMLPPMAIFFPLFTFLEDLGYLPRVAFNLDWLFRRAGAHGKQALTMAMGFGCNAAGVTACRVIDSPRERIIAILTNNFVPCNGRFPTLIMLASVFVAAAFPPVWASLAAAGSVVGIVLLGSAFALLVSWVLSRTWLRGEASSFTLELPPYRRPDVRRILYTSFVDRTIFVLLRAMGTAGPAGAVIWLLANVHAGDASLAVHIANALQPLGTFMGLDGVILLAFIIAIPANEIVVPTMLMVYMGVGRMTDVPSLDALRNLLVGQHGWTLLTAANLMLFSLLHNPCATTILTIRKETGSRKWAAVGALVPLAIGFVVTSAVAGIVRLLS
ncbi:MAG TPA: nucleoside recognition domain-containing protein [Anaerolineales bacterium]|nr:nucleoside recognition domain-containing protein [Anaerolineales bacterium]